MHKKNKQADTGKYYEKLLFYSISKEIGQPIDDDFENNFLKIKEKITPEKTILMDEQVHDAIEQLDMSSISKVYYIAETNIKSPDPSDLMLFSKTGVNWGISCKSYTTRGSNTVLSMGAKSYSRFTNMYEKEAKIAFDLKYSKNFTNKQREKFFFTEEAIQKNIKEDAVNFSKQTLEKIRDWHFNLINTHANSIEEYFLKAVLNAHPQLEYKYFIALGHTENSHGKTRLINPFDCHIQKELSKNPIRMKKHKELYINYFTDNVEILGKERVKCKETHLCGSPSIVSELSFQEIFKK